MCNNEQYLYKNETFCPAVIFEKEKTIKSCRILQKIIRCPIIGQAFPENTIHSKLSYVKTRGVYMARIIDGKEMNMVGDRVRELRLARKMSQQTLSNKLEMLAIYICRGSISRIEDKQRTVTDIELYGLAKVLNVSVEELYSGNQD